MPRDYRAYQENRIARGERPLDGESLAAMIAKGELSMGAHEPRVAQDRDLFGELTHAGTCGGCPWRGEQRNTWHAANRDARAHATASETQGPDPDAYGRKQCDELAREMGAA